MNGTNIGKDEKGDTVTDSHRFLSRWRNNFSQLLIIHGGNDVRQTENIEQSNYCQG